MSLISKLTTIAAAGSGGPTGSYIALAHSTSPYFTLLDHTTKGSVSSADTYTLNGAGQAVGFSPEGEYIAVGHDNVYFKLLDHTTVGSVSLTSSTRIIGDNVDYLSFSPTDTYIAVGEKNRVHLIDYSNPSSVSKVATFTFTGTENTVRGVDFSPDGNYIAVAHQSTPRFTLLDHTTAGSLSSADTYSITAASGDYFGAYSVAFSPVGDYIAVGMHGNGGYPRVVLLDHTTAGSVSLATTNALIPGRVADLSFSPDGKYLAATHATSPYFTLLDHTTAGSLSFAASQVLSANDGYSVAFSPDGKYIAVGHNSTTTTKFTLLDHTTAGSVSIADTFTGTGIVNGVAFSPN